ncbi:MAG: virulence factor SrfB [Methylobacterium sp.]|uniref:virulence factor SrfB n=1 Tax=Methylobacterium sp. TaxID=409 RepID=UPI0027222ACD|nr:virulence factor SrfB [Methylobacterium sp.]MDO9428511.1 virulence factor SrfB [Methylobacterium sp.]
MFVDPVTFGPTIRLVPHSGVQFVEYAFNIDTVGRLSRRFIEREVDAGPEQAGHRTYRLLPTWDETDPGADEIETARGTDRDYAIGERGALEVFLEKWTPVPMLRVKAGIEGGDELDVGPSNWARVRVVEVADRAPDSPVSHRVIFAFDTELLERRPNRPYTAPSLDDAANEHEFRFAFRFRDIGWFLGAASEGEEARQRAGFQEWVPSWLSEQFREFKAAQRPDRPLRDSDFPNTLEHYARYLVLLEYLQRAIQPRVMRLTDTVSAIPAIKPVTVDLILDIGNSRTCGILIESHPNEDRVDLNNSFVLQLRDLSEPEQVYAEPFESHVELSHARFGRDHLSRLSARPRAFFWPSPVRVGPEASRFRELAQGTEAVGGLSSPKRYLCDVRPVNQEWRFPDRDYGADGTSPLIDRTIRQFVNSRGDVIAQLDADRKRYGIRVQADDRVGASRLTFSRSSFFTFMVAEVVCHALSMINNAGVRERRRTKDAPRKLRRIILTLPPAMPVQEQRLLRSRAEGAVKLIWQLMGWTETPPPGLTQPEVHVAWDEASCVQFVYLYGEITQKLGGAVDGFLRLIGRPRPFAEPDTRPAPGTPAEPSVRIASIDVGGGTTDLMVTTYYAEGNRAIKPVQNFREGFRIAGDDILKSVIERLVLPTIEDALRRAGHPDPHALLLERFGGDRANMAEQEKHLRRQFVSRVLEPIGLRLLADVEAEGDLTTRPFAEFFPERGGRVARRALPQQRLLDFLEGPARRDGAAGFALVDCVFEGRADIVGACVVSVLDLVLDNLCEAIHALDVDVVLLSGRPSRLSAFVDLVVNKLAVSPDRVVPLHQYQAGNWYPFRDRDNRRIGDPKTTTAVGGMLCALAESQLTNFTLFTHRLGLRSTARYIGEMELSGQLRDAGLCFRDVDLDAPAAARASGPVMSASLRYYAPMRLGYRQLPVERWIATPLYRLRLRTGQEATQLRLPLDITLERSGDGRADDDSPDALIRSESMKEEFEITDAYDADGLDVKRKVELVLDTLVSEQGYWLDTGILSVD